MRTATLIINGVPIKHEEQGGLYFEADYNSGKTNEIGSMIFRIFNLSQEIEVGSVISYDFGRGNYYGRFGTFTVKKRNTYSTTAGYVQEVFCSERAVESSNIVNVELKGEITSSQAIREICSKAGLTVAELELKEDKKYLTSYSAYGKAYDELKKIADNCSSKFKIEDKEVYFYINEPTQKYMINLDFNSGLLKNPKIAEETVLDSESDIKAQNGEVQATYNTGDKLKSRGTNEYDYEIECLSIHTLKKGTVISISGNKTFNGIVRISSITMNNAEKWVMKLKCNKL